MRNSGDPDATDRGNRRSPPTDVSHVDGIAGASARREFERRKKAREERVRRNHPKIGGFLLGITDDPQSTRAWATGAEGEERLGRSLDDAAGPLLRVLHDRRIPGTRANIDHIVISPGEVLVVDAKRYAGRPSLRVEGGIFRPRTETLVVGRRDCTRLVDGVLRQRERVRKSLADRVDLPVEAALCFVAADWPLFGGDFVIRGIQVVWPSKLVARLAKVIRIAEPHRLTEDRVAEAHSALAAAFPPA
jgi:hypothetical protein